MSPEVQLEQLKREHEELRRKIDALEADMKKEPEFKMATLKEAEFVSFTMGKLPYIPLDGRYFLREDALSARVADSYRRLVEAARDIVSDGIYAEPSKYSACFQVSPGKYFELQKLIDKV